MGPRLFQRDIDLEGRLRLPDYLSDEYEECWISLGLFSSAYLQLTPDGVYLYMSDELGKAPFTDRESFRLQRHLHTGTQLVTDELGRVQIPFHLLAKAGINRGGRVVGEAGPTTQVPKPQTSLWGAVHPTYWTLWDQGEWLRQHPGGMYSLDIAGI